MSAKIKTTPPMKDIVIDELERMRSSKLTQVLDIINDYESNQDDDYDYASIPDTSQRKKRRRSYGYPVLDA